MEILIQSALKKMQPSERMLHIRYWDLKRELQEASGNANDRDGETQPNGQAQTKSDRKIKSYVIIRREYSHLEPIIRAIFNGAEDVQVLLDRRRSDRPEISEDDWPGNLQSLKEKRRASPMLDIVINMDG